MQYSPIFIFDPGHGGSNTGCRVGNIWEKDYTLDVTNLIVTAINAIPGLIKAYRTRYLDITQTLKQRAKIAKANNVNMAISFHVDSFTDDSLSGCSFYMHKDDILAQQVANDIHKNMPPGLKSKSKPFILLDGNETDYRRSAVNVLKYYNCPALLVECGYASNPEDLKILVSDFGKHQIAGAIIDACFNHANRINRICQ